MINIVFRKAYRASIFIALIVLVSVSAYASELSVPKTFESGTKALASEVNANFEAVEGAVNDNNSKADAAQSTADTAQSTAGTANSRSLTNAAQMPGIEFYTTAGSTAVSGTSGASTEVARVDVAVPGPGYISLDFSAQSHMNSAINTYNYTWCYIRKGTSANAATGKVGTGIFIQHYVGNASYFPLHEGAVYHHSGGLSTLTFTVNCWGNPSETTNVRYRTLRAAYFPKKL
jgi:hypothetical protein